MFACPVLAGVGEGLDLVEVVDGLVVAFLADRELVVGVSVTDCTTHFWLVSLCARNVSVMRSWDG